MGLARETRGKAANNSSTATTSHQVSSSARLHSQSCWHMGNREQRRQSALPRPCVVIPLRGARGICLLWTTGPGLQGAATRCVDSKRALQPLLTTGLERRQHSNLASRWPVLHGSPSTRWPHRDICFQRPGQYRTEPLRSRDYRRLQPLQKQLEMSAVPHQHYLVDISGALVITTMHLTR